VVGQGIVGVDHLGPAIVQADAEVVAADGSVIAVDQLLPGACGGLQGDPDIAAPGVNGKDTEVDIAEARHRARLTGLMLLSATRQALGSLDRVEAVVKLLGMVRATPEFGGHSDVINGCSELFIEVFGEEIGGHARSAVGMGSLPHGISVEIEAILLIRSN
jgi:enamine deaminase RidA (YjgF/YER057c/UK114 family)